MANVLDILPELEERSDVKIVAVTSPQLFEELRRTDPAKASEIFPDEERQYAITLHNGWRGFLYPFLLPGDYTRARVRHGRVLAVGQARRDLSGRGVRCGGAAEQAAGRGLAGLTAAAWSSKNASE